MAALKSSLRQHVDGRLGQQFRLLDSFDEARRGWRQQWLHESSDVVLDLFALSTEKFASTPLLKTLKGRDVGAEDELVDVLYKIFVKLLALLLLIRPVVSVGLGIDTVNLLVVLSKSFDSVFGELVGDLVAQNHVDMNNIRLDVNKLIVSGLHERIAGISLGVGLGCLG
jgi:hypothetical protein